MLKKEPDFTNHEPKRKSVGMEIKSMGNLLMRLMEKKSHKERVDYATGTNGWILGYLVENKESAVCQRDMEKKFCITRSTTSKVIALMEQKGLVERQGVEGDARLKQIVLTERGWDIFKLMQEDFEMAEAVLTKGFSKEETEQFYNMAERMKANIREELSK